MHGVSSNLVLGFLKGPTNKELYIEMLVGAVGDIPAGLWLPYRGGGLTVGIPLWRLLKRLCVCGGGGVFKGKRELLWLFLYLDVH